MNHIPTTSRRDVIFEEKNLIAPDSYRDGLKLIIMRDIFLKILNNISSLRDLEHNDILYSINILSLKGLSFCVTPVIKST